MMAVIAPAADLDVEPPEDRLVVDRVMHAEQGGDVVTSRDRTAAARKPRSGCP